MYRSADELIPLLDADSRAAMRVLVRIYKRLLDLIARDPAAVFRGRVSVPTSEKLLILAGGAARSLKARVLR
jgi:phytoene synthase